MRISTALLSENKDRIHFLSCCVKINGTAVYFYEGPNNSDMEKTNDVPPCCSFSVQLVRPLLSLLSACMF